jgi:hypothetical protein
MLFSWLTNRVRDSILAGVNEAVEEMTRDDGNCPAPVVLKLTLERTIPALVNNGQDAEPASKRKKG